MLKFSFKVMSNLQKISTIKPVDSASLWIPPIAERTCIFNYLLVCKSVFLSVFIFLRTGDFDFQNHTTCQKNETHRLNSQLLASASELGVWSSPTEFRILYPEMQSNVTAIDPSSKSDMRLTEHVNKQQIAVLIVRAFEISGREFCGGFSSSTCVHTESASMSLRIMSWRTYS